MSKFNGGRAGLASERAAFLGHTRSGLVRRHFSDSVHIFLVRSVIYITPCIPLRLLVQGFLHMQWRRFTDMILSSLNQFFLTLPVPMLHISDGSIIDRANVHHHHAFRFFLSRAFCISSGVSLTPTVFSLSILSSP